MVFENIIERFCEIVCVNIVVEMLSMSGQSCGNQNNTHLSTEVMYFKRCYTLTGLQLRHSFCR